ncbi:ComF family protein [Gehongia tenuis]|uniref:ComF family protein n=1 Tax=Gehongia tenuis TaxID=2763655 RepID=A0A926D506_9FIRM|nr:ComF family protein [Gehongia tenuis]MBC8531848.1 ComF family protein [Gehongia tenuis]
MKDWLMNFIRELFTTRDNCALCGRHTLELGKHGLCMACEESLPRLDDDSMAAFHYEDAAAKLIRDFKYGEKLWIADILAGYMADRVRELDGKADVIVPVPLHSSRLRQRGFNQALKLAEGLGRELSIPVVDGLVRLRKTKTQTKLNHLEREANVRGAFKVKDEISFDGMTVMLVDDVVTTGSTLKACGEEILKAGADEVIWVTAARTSEEKKEKE